MSCPFTINNYTITPPVGVWLAEHHLNPAVTRDGTETSYRWADGMVTVAGDGTHLVYTDGDGTVQLLAGQAHIHPDLHTGAICNHTQKHRYAITTTATDTRWQFDTNTFVTDTPLGGHLVNRTIFSPAGIHSSRRIIGGGWDITASLICYNYEVLAGFGTPRWEAAWRRAGKHFPPGTLQQLTQ